MKARIEKKLSNRLVQIAPTLFRDAWIDREQPSELAEDQRSRVSGVYSFGGSMNSWGDTDEVITTWFWWAQNWIWLGGFPLKPGNGYPDYTGFKSTTRNLLRLAAQVEEELKAKRGDR